jgi:hypothetical protein
MNYLQNLNADVPAFVAVEGSRLSGSAVKAGAEAAFLTSYQTQSGGYVGSILATGTVYGSSLASYASTGGVGIRWDVTA